MKGPKIYGRVLENRVDEALEPMRRICSQSIPTALRTESQARLEELFREVYMRGVIDGFAQGVEATDVDDRIPIEVTLEDPGD